MGHLKYLKSVKEAKCLVFKSSLFQRDSWLYR
jgi:hypothetical protein